MNLTLRQRLDKPARDGRCYVFLDVTWPKNRVTLPTGVKCLPAYFRPDKAQPVSSKDLAAGHLNARLNALKATVLKVAERAVVEDVPLTPAMLRAATGTRRANTNAPAAPPAAVTPTEFYARWKADNPGQTSHGARRYKQVVDHLEAYQPDWPVLELTRPELLGYLTHLAGLGLVDGTVSKHVKFLRECFRLGGLPVPGWLKLQTRYGRAPALRAEELQHLIAIPDLLPDLAIERDLFVLQTLLLLRDSDLRQLRAHHIEPVPLPGYGPVPVATFRQAKTGDEVRLPLPPAAAAIWERYAGQLPMPVQQERNRRMKHLARVAQLERSFVRVQYVQGEPVEELLPLHKVITTHTARHTGADMVMLGSGGDSNLKEKALGHAGVYGHDALERYGPALLRAWEAVLSKPKMDNNFSDNPPDSALREDYVSRPVRIIGAYSLPRLTN